jgi:predicted nuclease of predicted toxin-antitoxin system
MKSFLDQDVYAATARLLNGLGHDVVTAAGTGHARATDLELLGLALQQDRILVTRDRDFGSLVFLQNLLLGVIYLRNTPQSLRACHQELVSILIKYSEGQMKRSFIVVEPGRHRLRRLPG